MNQTIERISQAQTRVISFTGGKGGVGKTTSLVNVAVALARKGRGVLVLDADLGLANVDVILGLRPQYTIEDVLSGHASIEQILLNGPEGITIIPAASGVDRMCQLTHQQRQHLMYEVERIAARYDYLLIDTQAGIGSEVLYFNSASNEMVCVLNPEPTSLTDCYALIKVMAHRFSEKRFCILVNNAAQESDAQRVFDKLRRAVERFLQVELIYLGTVPKDGAISESIQEQQAVLDLFPSCKASRAFVQVADKIDSDFINLRVKGGMQFFFQKLLDLDSAYGS